MLKCSTAECECAAQCAPKICVPATSWPAVPEKSLQAIIDLPLCVKCCEKFDAKEQFVHPLKHLIFGLIFLSFLAKSTGSSLPPDKRAFVVKVWLDSDEYKTFANIKAKSDN